MACTTGTSGPAASSRSNSAATRADAALSDSERERLARFSILRLHGQTLPEQYEFQGVRRDGALIWLSATARTVEWDGSPADRAGLQESIRAALDALEAPEAPEDVSP